MKITWLFLSLLLPAGGPGKQDVKNLFDGTSLAGWEVLDYRGHGTVMVADSSIIIGKGEFITGIRWAEDFPTIGYEVTLDAKRIEGNDFFCGITFPVKDSFVTLVLGGWGGSLCGLSCIDGYDAANNFTGKIFPLGRGVWWPVRLRVTDEKIEAWTDGELIVDYTLDNSKLSLRSEVESSVPFGITTYKTTGAIRRIRLQRISNR